ncbi:hypothetical protein LIER_02935 [Lithospermum erythrorhizon]|uniref:Uncharacterized protein n=1 Tax=Lithospermum erythrorhizon TaxID=34254 RepID=A0AAV3NRB0_LITER
MACHITATSSMTSVMSCRSSWIGRVFWTLEQVSNVWTAFLGICPTSAVDIGPPWFGPDGLVRGLACWAAMIGPSIASLDNPIEF